MSYEMKEGQITLFENKKQKDNHPDMRGEMLINGEKKEVSLWRKESANGTVYYSGLIKEPFKKTGVSERPVPENTDLPF